MRNCFLYFFAFLILSSCSDKTVQSYTANVPVYMAYEDLRASFEISAVRDMQKPGKIYFKEPYLYINEYQEGIHIIDMNDPKNPEALSFISIPGNVDMAIRNNVLYADSYIDLLLIDISNPEEATLLKRIEDMFEYVIPPYDNQYPLAEIDRDKGVIKSYEQKKVSQEIRHHPNPWPIYWEYSLDSRMSASGAPKGGTNSYGVGGSMARFLSYGDFLYTLESTSKLKSINISNTEAPELLNELYLWGNVETLFIAETFLYVGTSNGMHILDLAEPSVPILLSTYQHITACDPVVVEGDVAYVTLRSGNFCGGNQDLLEVIDIRNKYEPVRMASYGMVEPYGLGISNNTLFVCEGDFGLKVYDSSNPREITSNKLAEFSDIHAWDVIPLPSYLLTIGEDGFYIYDYSDLSDIKLLGSLPVKAVE